MSDRSPAILHVDDDEANRYAVTRSLRRAGFHVTEAANGAEAIRQAQTAKPDLVILDICLPDIDGFEVCRRLKRDPATSTIPVLHLSASRVSSSDKAFGLDGGADGYLVRPVEAVELVATVNALLRVRTTEAALQEREQQFKALIDGVRDYAIFALDTAGRIASWNLGAANMTGYSVEEAIGTDFARLFTQEQRESGLPSHEMRVAAETGECKMEGSRMRRDGSLFDAACVLTATRSADGALLGYLKLMQDVSDRKRIEATRERLLASEQAARIEAERVGRMKDEFLATLSHEIRTPLNAILGWSQLLQKRSKDKPEEVAHGLNIIERNARAQAQIIEDLLDMSRIISGKITLDVRPIEVEPLVRAAVESVTPAAEAKGIRLSLTSDGAGGQIFGDAGRLQQVLWNLLSNAIKFTPANGRVDVAIGRARASLDVRITDTGEGIDPLFLPHVFDRFRQADASTTRRHGGLGIGLSIVKQLIEMHGGNIIVASDGPGRGATFLVTLPVATKRKADAGAATTAAPASRRLTDDDHDPSGDIGGLRVLVLDDEADARTLVERLLNDRGAIVTAADTVDAALRLLQSADFDVLVSDIGMPGEDGYSLVRRVRALAPPHAAIPMVAVTAYARAEDGANVTEAGFQSHVTKPVDATRLVNEVARVTGRGS